LFSALSRDPANPAQQSAIENLFFNLAHAPTFFQTAYPPSGWRRSLQYAMPPQAFAGGAPAPLRRAFPRRRTGASRIPGLPALTHIAKQKPGRARWFPLLLCEPRYQPPFASPHCFGFDLRRQSLWLGPGRPGRIVRLEQFVLGEPAKKGARASKDSNRVP